jgi:hypothetical protein
VAYETLLGYQIGKWFHLAPSSGIVVPWFVNNAPIFYHPDSAPWTFLYFWTTFLYPSLHTQLQAGDSCFYVWRACALWVWLTLPLLDCHVRYLDADLDRCYQLATTALIRRDMALVGFANLTFWLGGLRSSETFGIH